MKYTVELTQRVERDIEKHEQAGDSQLVMKIFALVDEISQDPRRGRGKPERLRYYKGGEFWSRRINHRHRLLYQIHEGKLLVVAISAYGHYDDK